MKNRKLFPILIYLLVLVLFFSWILGLVGNGGDGLSYSEIVDLFKAEQVTAFQVEDRTITMELSAPYEGKTTVKARLADVESFRSEMWDIIQQQSEAGILRYYDFVPGEEPGTKS